MSSFPFRIGHGIDFHVLQEGRDLYLGGVKIPHYKGALGHSDADVLLHAICDALLGAIGAGDIGVHFPNTDAQYKDIDSKILLKKVYKLLQKDAWEVVNIDATLLLEMPKIKPYINQMQHTISQILEIAENAVSIKATTTEKLGFIGREEGLEAHAVVLIKKV